MKMITKSLALACTAAMLTAGCAAQAATKTLSVASKPSVSPSTASPSASTSPSPSATPDADDALPYVANVTLAQAHQDLTDWIDKYNSSYRAINKASQQNSSTLIGKVMWGAGATTQEAELAYAHIGDDTPGPGLSSFHLKPGAEFWVPRQIHQGKDKWFIVKATKTGESLPRYFVFEAYNGVMLLLEDPQAHSGLSQPRPVFDADGYVTIASHATGAAVGDEYSNYWNDETHAQALTAPLKLASDNWSVVTYPKWEQGLRGKVDTYEYPYGVQIEGGGSFYVESLYNDLQHVVDVVSVGVTVNPAATEIEEPAGDWTT